MQHKLLSQSNRWQAVWQTRFISVSTLTDKQKYLHVGFLLSQTTTESHIDSLFIQPAWSHTSWSGIRDVVSVKHQRVQDYKSKAIPLWITHPEGIPVRGVLANHAELNLKRERGLTFACRATGFSFSQIIESIMCTRSNGKQLTVGIQPLRKLLDRHSSLNTVSCNIWQLLVEEPHKN